MGEGITAVQVKILSELKAGEKNAISKESLRQIVGLNERQLRREIHDLRLAGYIICSSSASGKGGYYLPENPAEAAAFVRSMHSRAKSVFAAASAANKQVKAEGTAGNG